MKILNRKQQGEQKPISTWDDLEKALAPFTGAVKASEEKIRKLNGRVRDYQREYELKERSVTEMIKILTDAIGKGEDTTSLDEKIAKERAKRDSLTETINELKDRAIPEAQEELKEQGSIFVREMIKELQFLMGSKRSELEKLIDQAGELWETWIGDLDAFRKKIGIILGPAEFWTVRACYDLTDRKALFETLSNHRTGIKNLLR